MTAVLEPARFVSPMPSDVFALGRGDGSVFGGGYLSTMPARHDQRTVGVTIQRILPQHTPDAKPQLSADECWSTSGSLPFHCLSLSLQVSLLKVAALSRLQADWDSYGSPPIRSEALRSAVVILQIVDSLRPGTGHVTPVAGGGIQLSWRRGERELELEVLPDGSAIYLKAEGDNVEENDVVLESEPLRALVRWLVSN